MTAAKPLPVFELYVPIANVAPVGICEATLVPAVRLEVAPLVLVPVTVELRLPAQSRSPAAAARFDDAGAGRPGRFVTP